MADQIIVNKSLETATSAVKPILGLQPGKRGNMTSQDDNDFALSISLDLAVSPAKRLSLHMRKTTGTALKTLSSNASHGVYWHQHFTRRIPPWPASRHGTAWT